MATRPGSLLPSSGHSLSSCIHSAQDSACRTLKRSFLWGLQEKVRGPLGERVAAPEAEVPAALAADSKAVETYSGLRHIGPPTPSSAQANRVYSDQGLVSAWRLSLFSLAQGLVTGRAHKHSLSLCFRGCGPHGGLGYFEGTAPRAKTVPTVATAPPFLQHRESG